MRRERYTVPFVLLLVLSPVELGNVTLSRSARAIDDRLKYKYLIFPQGSNVQLVYCLTIGTYSKPEGFFTVGVTAGLAYELPYRKTVPHRKPAEVYHRRSRRDLYRKLEVMLRTQGKDGRGCVMKALCLAGKRNRKLTNSKASFTEEILHAIFTYPEYYGTEGEETEEEKLHDNEYDGAYNTESDCDTSYPSCPQLFSSIR